MIKHKKQKPPSGPSKKYEVPQSKRNILRKTSIKYKQRTLLATCTEGWIRYEWALARFGQIIPMNWELTSFDVNYSVVGYGIDDAYNLITKQALDMGVEWLITIEDDVLIPKDLFVKFQKYQEKADIPIVSGLYYLKAEPTAPLIFRGRGTGSYNKFRVGDKVWCDGLPMGCLLIHTSILKWMWERCEEYTAIDGTKLRRVFESPREIFFDPESMIHKSKVGTQDLYFFDQLLAHKVLKETGWGNIGRLKYPFLCDTSIYCGHIDRQTGRIYP